MLPQTDEWQVTQPSTINKYKKNPLEDLNVKPSRFDEDFPETLASGRHNGDNNTLLNLREPANMDLSRPSIVKKSFQNMKNII